MTSTVRLGFQGSSSTMDCSTSAIFVPPKGLSGNSWGSRLELNSIIPVVELCRIDLVKILTGVSSLPSSRASP